MATAELVERRALEDIDRSIMTFQQTMEEAAQTGALDAEQLGRFSATFKAAAARINERVLPQIDPDAAAEMSQRLIAILTLDPAAYGALDAADQYLIDLEAIRHVLRDLLQEQPPQGVRKEPREVIALLEQLSGVLTPQAGHDWLFSPNPMLGHEKPVDLLAEGEWRRVLGMISALGDGVFA